MSKGTTPANLGNSAVAVQYYDKFFAMDPNLYDVLSKFWTTKEVDSWSNSYAELISSDKGI